TRKYRMNSRYRSSHISRSARFAWSAFRRRECIPVEDRSPGFVRFQVFVTAQQMSGWRQPMSLDATARREELDRLLSGLRTDAETAVENRFVRSAEAGQLGRAQIARFLVAEHSAQSCEFTAFASLAARFPVGPAAGFFLDLACAVRCARAPLAEAAKAVDVSLEPWRVPLVSTEAHAFGAYLCWLAARASQAGAALAVYTDFIAWCGACSRIAAAARTASPLPDAVVAYFAGYAQEPEALLAAAVDVVRDGLSGGDDPAQAEAEARLVLGYLTRFWNTAADLSA
ncbi:hypothetical protein, partial [Amycolatopsis lurida]|uniref:hypothetical protein n=1 Tax=Amycolatopsis lurida TaxID=31959 RepID=UPI00365B9C69